MDTPEARARRAAAAAPARTVAHPRLAVLSAVVATTLELGAAGLRRAVRAISNPHEYASEYDARAATSAGGGVEAPADAGSALQIREGAHWLAYATAAYAPTAASFIERLAELGVGGVGEGDVIYALLAPRPLLQPHVVVRDAARKVLVVAIRCTCTLRDILADMAAKPIPFAGGAAHTGMVAAVDGLLHYAVPHLNVPQGDPDGAAAAGGGASAGGGGSGGGAAASLSPPENAFAVPFVRAMFEAAHQQQQQPLSLTPGLGASRAQTAAAVAVAAAASVGAAPVTVSPYLALPAMERVGLGGVAAILQRAIAAYPDHRIVVTGHSLGAGIAALLTLKLTRVLLYMRRQQLESLAAAAAPAAGEAAATGGGRSSNSVGGGSSAHGPPVLTSYFLAARLLHCWAYAPPACASPALAALASLSLSDLEDAALDDPAFLTALAGAETARVFVAQRDATRAAAAAAGGETEWAMLRTLPIVTSIAYGADLVPRLTLASLSELAARVREPQGTPGGTPVAATANTASTATCSGSVVRALQWLRRGCAAAWCRCGGGSTTAAMHARGGAGAVIPAAASAQPLASSSPVPPGTGLQLIDEYSPTFAALTLAEDAQAAGAAVAAGAAMAAAAAAPTAGGSAGPATTPRSPTPSAMLLHESVLATEALHSRAQHADLEAALRATAVPEPVVRRVLNMLQVAGLGWADPEQALVVPGCLYHVLREPQLTDPSALTGGTMRTTATAPRALALPGAPGGGLPLAAAPPDSPTARICSTTTTTTTITAAAVTAADAAYPVESASRAVAVVAAPRSVESGGGDAAVAAVVLPQQQPRGGGTSTTTITVGRPGAQQRRYTIRRVAPSALRHIQLSPTLLSDHMVDEYRQCMVALRAPDAPSALEPAAARP